MVMQPQQYQQPTVSPPAGGPMPDYGFITNPSTPPAKKLVGPPKSLLMKIVVAALGILIVLVIFGVIKSVLGGGGSDVASLTSVAQQQQSLIQISSGVKEQQGISTATLNSAITIKSTVTSAQQQLLAYIGASGGKVDPKQLELKVDSATDTQLKTAAAAGNYEQTYLSVMQSQLTDYKQYLKDAYGQISGAKGKALLNAQFDEAELLSQQLSPTQ